MSLPSTSDVCHPAELIGAVALSDSCLIRLRCSPIAPTEPLTVGVQMEEVSVHVPKRSAVFLSGELAGQVGRGDEITCCSSHVVRRTTYAIAFQHTP